MSSPSWKQHFGNIVTGYDAVEAQGLSELGFALKNNQISQEQYLDWARAAYELCSLDMKFFQEQLPSRPLFERFKESYSWSVECLPVGEWDDHLIIAGLEKPADLPPELKPIFILAPFSGLESYWERYQGEASTEKEGDGSHEEAGGLPDGLAMQADAAPLSFAGISLGGAPAPQAVLKTASQANPEINLKINEDSQVNIPTVTKTAPQAKAPVIPPPAFQSAMEPEVKAQPQVIAVASSEGDIPEAAVVEALDTFKNHYEKRIYLEFDPVKKTVIAKYWPQDFVATQGPSPHSLVQDSFLSIVSKTQKPYHGHIVKCAVSDAFFKELNQGVTPENITIVPLVRNEEVIGALVGWGAKTTYTLGVLRDVQKATNDLILKLGWITAEAA